MIPTVVVAIIAAFASLLTSAWTLHRQAKSGRALARLQHELDQEARRQERQLDAKAQLDRHREPLLEAAQDLLHRVRNIRERQFLAYLHSPDEQRQQLALLGTLYRLGKYWATVDALYRMVNILRFETVEETKAVAQLLAEIGSTFASDGVDGSRLMVWREEQRAIAELMRPGEDSGGLEVIGFATFTARYPTRLASWFYGLERDFEADGVELSPRLDELQRLLGCLVEQLEAGRTYVA